MAEATDKLGLVEGIGGHLHSPHGGHLGVHLEEHVLGDLNLERRHLAVVSMEGLFMELQVERLRLGLWCGLLEAGGVCRGLQASHELLGTSRD